MCVINLLHRGYLLSSLLVEPRRCGCLVSRSRVLDCLVGRLNVCSHAVHAHCCMAALANSKHACVSANMLATNMLDGMGCEAENNAVCCVRTVVRYLRFLHEQDAGCLYLHCGLRAHPHA